MIALWAWSTGRLRGFRIAPDEWRPLIVIALIFTAQIATMNVGTALTSAAHGSVVLNLYAVHTVVLAHFLIPGDRLTLRRLVGVLVAYGGIVLLFAGEGGGAGASLLGDAIVFVSAFLLAERTVYLARAVHHLDPVKLLLSQAAIGVAIFLVLSLLLESAPTRWTLQLAGSLAYQGALIAGFCFIINLWLLRRYRPERAGGVLSLAAHLRRLRGRALHRRPAHPHPARRVPGRGRRHRAHHPVSRRQAV